ncbi:hypothetical protein C8R47DRAFT_1219382 [Mycena vitilis]|nr:hypothetical protein C8R47DRAFT_1219382 [Mycena vitilis]
MFHLTGALLKASLHNPPLPRMKPQPSAISQMIRTRMRARDRRFARQEQLLADLDDLKHEAALEEHAIRLAGLRGTSPVYCRETALEWQAPLHAAHTALAALLHRDTARSQTPPAPALLAILRTARREKIANKSKERMRERRGEVLRCTVARARKGPPAHLLPRMTAAQRHADRVVRGVGEVGYVGLVKMRMGVRLRDGGAGLAREDGMDLEGERARRLREMERECALEGMRRMRRNNTRE